jgi:pimeloyl-ACP methyl ester carboxylesterase
MAKDSALTDFVEYEGQEMAYSVYGKGPRVVVLTHGILLNKEMFRPLAQKLAERGNRVVAVDMVGHGQSDADSRQVSVPFYGRAVLHLMNELGIKEAVLGGTSLGGNVTLEVAVEAPERVRGIVVEMPALENAILGGAAFFGPLLGGARLAAPFARIGMYGIRMIPRGVTPYASEIVLDVMRRDPKSTAGVIEGVFFNRLAPSSEQRRKIEAPALVLGHRFDPIHPFKDALNLAEELPNSRFVEARGPLELRLTPKRLTLEIAAFLEECWKPRVVKSKSGGAAARRRGSKTAL